MNDDLGLQTVTAIVRGAQRPSRRYAKTAAWIEEKYGVPVITILDAPTRDLRRVVVWVRTAADATRFRERGLMQQHIQDEVAGHILAHESRRIFARSKKPFIIVNAFEVSVLDHKTALLGIDGHRELEKLIDEPALAELVVFGQWIIFFMHTDAQKASYVEKSKAWQRIVVDHFARDDEFGVVVPEAFTFTLDSKETLARDYEGSTYYYLK